MARTNNCPECGDPLSTHGVCGSCGYGLSKGKRGKPITDPSHNDGDRYAILAEQARQRYLATPPTSADLTDQQWYNVCKFFPNVAAHCKRSRPQIGPDHPLDATAKLGPITRRFRPMIVRRGDDPDALEERAAIQSEV